jgi:hypothetical protein
VAHTVRYRFAALDLADGWVDMGRVPLRKELRHEGRPEEFSISVSPVPEGATVDFATLVGQQGEWKRQWDECVRSGRLPALLRLEVVSWEELSAFGVGWRAAVTQERWRRVFPVTPRMRWMGHWTASDGRYVLRATLTVSREDAFHASVSDCDAMIRSVRFEGPS